MKSKPYVTIALILVNVIVFYWMSLSGNADYIVSKYAMSVPAVINDGEWYRVFTHMFLHADTHHLFNNMIMLLAVGYSIEEMYGHVKFTITYFVGGLGACALSGYYDTVTGSYPLSVGASGAIMAIFAAMLVLSFKNRRSFDKGAGIRMIVVLAIMVFGNMSYGVDWMAHLGGAITGLILGFILTIGSKNKY